ncbi:MAG: murein hydrolase activator EnvC family protein [Patescibacteria group bacterium]
MLEQMKQRIEDAKNSLKEQKLEVTTRKFTLTTMLADLDTNIATNEQGVADAEERIRDKNKTIADTIRNIAELQDRIDANKEVILGYLSYLYSKGDMVYDGENQVDVIRTLVLSDGNLSDILSDIHFKTILEVTGQNFIEERRALVKDYYVKTATLKEDKAKIITLKKDLEAKRVELDEQKAYKLQLLALTQGQETLFNQYIADHQEKEQKVEDRLTVAIAAYDGAFQEVANRHKCKLTATGGVIIDKNSPPKCADLRDYYESEKNLRDHGFDDTAANPFEWPVTPKYISSYYKDADYYGSVGSEHEAIDIPTEQGTNIVAPAPGYVYYINEPTQNGYGYVAIKHANGYVTVYGHVSEILAKKFDFIDKGQVFAKSGGAPGTKGAGVMTSGAHLHFEVHHNRETVDPLRLLDLTKLRFESLATKYKYKFVEDLKLRYGYMANTDKYNTFAISGDTEIDRQKYLLKTYAGADFRNWDTWTEEAVEAKLDPSFLMCIGLAETGLGRSLKTQYNVGNIGNTDSGDTSAFISPRDGIYWMGKTLNNKFLGQYESLSDLSRW